jgi:predicted alpha/beta superfamily hydrolase
MAIIHTKDSGRNHSLTVGNNFKNSKMRNKILLFILIGFLNSGFCYSQDVNVKIGVKDSIQSKVMNVTRHLVVSLPLNYETSTENYPVLYVLDGNETALLNAILVTRLLSAEFILVAIGNTDRDRDMMPLSTPTYQVDKPQAKNFLAFIGDELIPHIEKRYRSNGQRTIRGTSLSGLFVMYAFLSRPELFDNYIGNSAGWYEDMNYYFGPLTDKAFKNKYQFTGKKLFVANSLADPFDPKKEVHNEMLEFSKKVKSELGDRMSFNYVTYDNYGHVPYPSFYDGLKFVLESKE